MTDKTVEEIGKIIKSELLGYFFDSMPNQREFDVLSELILAHLQAQGWRDCSEPPVMVCGCALCRENRRAVKPITPDPHAAQRARADTARAVHKP